MANIGPCGSSDDELDIDVVMYQLDLHRSGQGDDEGSGGAIGTCGNLGSQTSRRCNIHDRALTALSYPSGCSGRQSCTGRDVGIKQPIKTRHASMSERPVRRQLQIVDKEIELSELGPDIFQITFPCQIGDAHLDHRIGFASKDARERARAFGTMCKQHEIIPAACQAIGVDQANRTGCVGRGRDMTVVLSRSV